MASVVMVIFAIFVLSSGVTATPPGDRNLLMNRISEQLGTVANAMQYQDNLLLDSNHLMQEMLHRLNETRKEMAEALKNLGTQVASNHNDIEELKWTLDKNVMGWYVHSYTIKKLPTLAISCKKPKNLF